MNFQYFQFFFFHIVMYKKLLSIFTCVNTSIWLAVSSFMRKDGRCEAGRCTTRDTDMNFSHLCVESINSSGTQLQSSPVIHTHPQTTGWPSVVCLQIHLHHFHLSSLLEKKGGNTTVTDSGGVQRCRYRQQTNSTEIYQPLNKRTRRVLTCVNNTP